MTAAAEAPPVRRALGSVGTTVLVLAGLVVVGGWHLTQGTTGVGASDLLDVVLGRAERSTVDVVVDSRSPRLLAGLVVGIALGAAGAVFQSLSRNALASPDTLAVNSGAYAAVAVVVALDLPVPFFGTTFVAFAGALAAAGVVMLLAGGGAASTTRLVLAGTALALALDSLGDAMLLLFSQETLGLFAWNAGTLTQTGLSGVTRMGPLVLVTLAVLLFFSRRFDILALGDDQAAVLGVRVRTTRVAGTVLAVFMCACAVNLAGPIGFIGLAAPAAVRLLARAVPGLSRHVVLVPLSGLVGALLVVLADAGMRAVIGADDALRVPTGVTTTALGAVVLVVLARRGRDAGPTRRPPAARAGARHGRARLVVVLTVLTGLAVAGVVAGLLLGYTRLLLGDVVNYVSGDAVPLIQFALDERAPRVVAAVTAGAALALAGTVIQAVCRNPLAEPSILGITSGAGVGAVAVVTAVGSPSVGAVSLAAAIGALVAFALVYGLSWRGGIDSDRIVLVGLGVAAFGAAVTSLMLVYANPFDTPKIFTWLAGSTYDRTWGQVVPVILALVVAVPIVLVAHRDLDLLALDDDSPRLVGIRVERLRLLTLAAAALLTSTAVSAVGAVGFVGLVAPHAARALVSGRHLRVVPVAVLLGAVLLSVADTIGRTVIAPSQLPAGLVVAAVGAPYFLWLLHRSRP